MTWIGQTEAVRLYAFLKRGCLLLAVLAAVLLVPSLSNAQTKRIVVIKVDGLPYELVDSFVKERDQRTGKSKLPWFDYVFYQRGTRLSNFYTRGMSLSAPSWSTLDTGQHLQIKGNVEFDRYTLHAYDYLNFIPFYLKSAAGMRIDMPGAEVLDSLDVPLVADAFAHEDRYIGFQLFQRGMRFATLKDAMQKRFMKHPRDLLDEWTMGLDMRTPFFDQMERELIDKLRQPNTKYLDLYVSGFDHVAHHVNDRRSHLAEVQVIDALVGRIWTAIQKSPMAQETTLVVVSDHGFNSVPGVYSQGYNLVKLLGTPAGGGHHVVTKRRLMLDYSLKGINFLVPLITTTTDDSYYLTGQSTDYPTALLDFDGNERASLHLRDTDLNLLHILLQELQRNNLTAPIRAAALNEFFNTIDRRRSGWQRELADLNEELAVLRVFIEKQRQLWEAEPKKFSPEEIRLGRDDQKKRVFAQLERWMSQEKDYTEYLRTLTNLLALKKESFSPAKIKIEDVIAKRAMGEKNTVGQLQNYVVGLSSQGLKLNAQGSLDLVNSFRRVNYFTLLQSVTTKNNVQPQVGNRPIDMIVCRVQSDRLEQFANEKDLMPDAVWVYGGPDKQALILARENQGRLSMRYVPIKNLSEDSSGRLQFEPSAWGPGFPLRIFEDQELAIRSDRQAWLSEWHTDLEWLHALHNTKYSNGVVGLYEEVARHALPVQMDEPGLTSDQRVMLRFARRQRHLIETDLLLVANDHWNFDVRGFNPGGNHGSFFRISTLSTLMFAGGNRTGIPRGAHIEEPYDSLSFAPTVLALTGNLRDDYTPNSTLWNKGFRRFPGRPITEVLTLRSNGNTAAGAEIIP
ncbi:MAG TPA: alkaline phosphatase family protein [Pyrinomonadaceae bacterium]|nr:alkaline phosphatase family protein [Pyrinomonadaceae bacterium]